jgi:AcrR family transcriptional regulator
MAENARSSRESIEDAAAEEFREFGYHGARVDRIAKRSGLNKQLIYYYFGSKRKLYAHTLETAARRMRLDAASRRALPTGPTDRLRMLLERSLTHAAGTPDLLRAVVLNSTDMEAGSPLRELAAEFAREFSRGQGLGHYRDDADCEVLGRQAATLVIGWIMTAHAFGDNPATHGAWATAVAGTLSRALSW